MQKLVRLIQRVCLALLLTTACWLGATIPAITAAQSVPLPESPGGLFGLRVFTGKQPTNLGVDDGKLAPCPSTPNCVSSQSSDENHKINPLTFRTTPDKAFAQLKRIIENTNRARIVSESPQDYLYAEFTSQILGFVDDVEFYLDQQGNLIHVRSASRLGQSDLGVNRKRVENIRAMQASAGDA